MKAVCDVVESILGVLLKVISVLNKFSLGILCVVIFVLFNITLPILSAIGWGLPFIFNKINMFIVYKLVPQLEVLLPEK